jgi:hypothetical protein
VEVLDGLRGEIGGELLLDELVDVLRRQPGEFGACRGSD